MKAKIIKDWAHSLAPDSIFRKGSVVELSAADIHAGIGNGYVQDPNKPEEKEAPIKKEQSTSKKHQNKR